MTVVVVVETVAEVETGEITAVAVVVVNAVTTGKDKLSKRAI